MSVADVRIESPKVTDIDELLRLYFVIYGRSYPVAYGTDPVVMARAMSSHNHEWLIARDYSRGVIAGSVVFELDPLSRLGKVAALVVHPDYRKLGIATRLTEGGTRRLLSENSTLNSLYTTTRTLSVGPQLTFLRQGYLPLGIFPNAHKLRTYETTTLLAKFRPGVLERRVQPAGIPQQLARIYEVVSQFAPQITVPPVLPSVAPTPPEGGPLEFEAIQAPHYALRRFYEAFSDPYDRFYPFHLPNLIFAEKGGAAEIYAHFSHQDAYCTVVALTHPFYELQQGMPALLETMKAIGVSYVEVLIGVEHSRSIRTLLDAQFLPSALYPAMRESDGALHDLVVMTRTMEPLDFRGMAIGPSFKPYVDQYIDLWKKMHLETLEVLNEYS
jgi:GNAT superfamily N-acetyltransferase